MKEIYMIIVTGGAGFIGSALIWALNERSQSDILVVDRLGTKNKWQNLVKRKIGHIIHKDEFLPWLKTYGKNSHNSIELIIHLGACSSTFEMDMDYLLKNNVDYSRELFEFCREQDISYIYASSAATYGGGEKGYSDKDSATPTLCPINPYGFSKQLFDMWVLQNKDFPAKWAGLKFFNVYGPNEYHKESMMSIIAKSLPYVKEHNSLKLFKSYLPDYKHGEQKRDFIYVKDVVDVILHFVDSFKKNDQTVTSGIYNVGTGKARTFADLGRCIFKSLEMKPQFDWIEMPDSLKNQYQYFTEADLTKLRKEGGYKKKFTSLEDGVKDYVLQYLNTKDPYL